MSEKIKSEKPKPRMVQIKPGLWVSSARRPSEDSADWSKFTMTEEEVAMANLKKDKIVIERELITLQTNHKKLPGLPSKTLEDKLDEHLCNAFGVKPKDLGGDFIHEVRKYMYQDPLWNKAGISDEELKQFQQNCKAYAQKVLAGELISCAESVTI